MHFQFVLKNKGRAVQAVLGGLARGSAVKIDAREAEPVATAMVVVLTYWLSYEYVCNPRKALEPGKRRGGTGARRLPRAELLMPYLEPPARDHLHGLVAPYRQR